MAIIYYRMMKYIFLVIGFFAITSIDAQKKPAQKKTTKHVVKPVAKKIVTPKAKERLVEITTDYGTMIAKLYNETPLHRDNFIKLVQEGFYDSLLFHRVIKEFMIQGGDPLSKNAPDSVMLGMGEAPGERIPAEFRPNFIHKKGALAAARDNNPAKASSNCQFYIVEGKKMDTAQLNSIYNQAIKQNNPSFKYSNSQKEIYQRIGGTPFLDQNYTVFGEVISGIEVIDKIASAQTQSANRPAKNIMMKIRLLN